MLFALKNRSNVKLCSPERVPPAGTYILSERARIEGQFVAFGAASAGVARNGRLEPIGAVDAAGAATDDHHSAAAAVGRTGRALAAVVRRLHAPVRAHHLRQAHGFLGFLFSKKHNRWRSIKSKIIFLFEFFLKFNSKLNQHNLIKFQK